MYDWPYLMSTTTFWRKAQTDLSHLKEQEKFEHASDFKWVCFNFNRHSNKDPLKGKEGNEYETKTCL